MTMKKFSDYTVSGCERRPIQQLIDEVQREADVRRRIYDRWVAEGKLSRSDAHDRLERLMGAWKALIELSVLLDKVQAGNEVVILSQVRNLCYIARGEHPEVQTERQIVAASFDEVRQAVAAS